MSKYVRLIGETVASAKAAGAQYLQSHRRQGMVHEPVYVGPRRYEVKVDILW